MSLRLQFLRDLQGNYLSEDKVILLMLHGLRGFKRCRVGNSEHSHYIMWFTESYCKFITCSCKLLFGQLMMPFFFFFDPEHPDGLIRIEVLGTPSAKSWPEWLSLWLDRLFGYTLSCCRSGSSHIHFQAGHLWNIEKPNTLTGKWNWIWDHSSSVKERAGCLQESKLNPCFVEHLKDRFLWDKAESIVWYSME